MEKREGREQLELAEQKLGYHFQDRTLALRALSHRSLNSENPKGPDAPRVHNEQLEFLGDSVLGLVVSEHLFAAHPELAEGKLSQKKARLVSAVHLAEAARHMNLGECLILGRGEELSGGREKKALLADTLEALIGAAYLDGGLPAARGIIQRCITAIQKPEDANAEDVRDYKSALQEMAQSQKLAQPVYAIVQASGPEHAKTFTVEARVGAQWSERATGLTKKAAGQEAARILLQRMRSETLARA